MLFNMKPLIHADCQENCSIEMNYLLFNNNFQYKTNEKMNYSSSN